VIGTASGSERDLLSHRHLARSLPLAVPTQMRALEIEYGSRPCPVTAKALYSLRVLGTPGPEFLTEIVLTDKTLLSLKDVTAQYGDVQVLWGVTFTVREAEIATLVGANGAGKTTTLKTISGVVPATGGQIVFDGERIERLASHEIAARGIAHVPEGRRLFPLMSVKENLELGAITGQARRVRAESFERVFGLFPKLRERERQMAGTLSGGEQQMVAIARGLMARPRLLILDEPSLGLAPIIVREMFETIQAINREGITVLLVEQNVQQSLKLAGRAYVLENGRVVLEGSGSELLDDQRVREAYLGA
jgi:branched-chain amino acid transport system ATP-binding protein